MSEGMVCSECGAPILVTAATKSGWAHARPGSGHAADPTLPEIRAIERRISEDRARNETPKQRQQRERQQREYEEEELAYEERRRRAVQEERQRAAHPSVIEEERRGTGGPDPDLVQLGSVVLMAWGVLSAFTGGGTTSGRLAISVLLVIAGVALWRWAREEASRRLDRHIAEWRRRDARPGPDPNQGGE